MKKNERADVSSFARYLFLTVVACLLSSTNMLASASANAQGVHDLKIEIELKEASIEHAFELIESRTPFEFFYKNRDLSNTVKLDLPKQEYVVADVLKLIAKRGSLKFRRVNNSISVSAANSNGSKNAPVIVEEVERTITGVVTGTDDGQPLPFVNILIKGTVQGTTSDVDGKYEITVPGESSVLIYRFAGYVGKEETVGNRTVINVELTPDVKSLGEVVVTGVASETPKEKLSFTIASVDSEVLTKAPASNAGNALVGKIAGLRVSPSSVPGEAPSILLRGATNLRTSNGPLILLDGAILEGSLSDINVQDIDRYEVLKGASAATLYGSRAANGVIAIYTKSGKNLKVGQTDVFVRSEVTMERSYKDRHPEKAKFHNKQVDANGNIITDADGLALDDTPSINDKPFAVYKDHLDDFFEGSTSFRNYVRLMNRTANGNMSVSFEQQNASGGIAMHDGNTRYNFSAGLDQNFADVLDLKVRSRYIWDKDDTRPRDIQTLIFASPDADFFAPNEEDGSPYNYNANSFVLGSYFNPFYQLANRESERIRKRFIASVQGDVHISEALKFTGLFGFDTRADNSTGYTDIGYLANANGIPEEGDVDRGYYEEVAMNASAAFSYIKQFGDWNLRSTLKYQYEDDVEQGFNIDGDFLGVAGFDNFRAVRADTSGLGYQFLSVGDTRPLQIRSDSYALAVGGDYKDRYIFDFVVRRDGSSLFGEDERWQWFSRGSLAWRITQDFQIDGVDELKVSASLGTAGGRPGFNDQYEIANVSNGLISFPQQLANPNLKPNITTEAEFTLSSQFLDKFDLLVSYSTQENRDQLLSVPVSVAATGGRSTQIQNAATLSTNTIEFTLGYKAINKADLGLTFDLVGDRTVQTITEFNAPQVLAGGAGIWKEGSELTQMYGRRYAKSLSDLTVDDNGIVLNGQFAGLGNTSTIDDYEINDMGFVIPKGSQYTSDERVVPLVNEDGEEEQELLIGNARPDLNLGIRTGFRFKAFNIYMLWETQIGGDIYNAGLASLDRDGLGPDYDQAHRPEGQRHYTSFRQSIYNGRRLNAEYVEDASHVRLRELSINYNMTAPQLERIGLKNVFKSVQLSFIANNVLLFAKYRGFDPMAGGINTRYDSYTFPLIRTFSGSLSLNF
ncbi:SusC/RagA family TonB-linked outer membrane protein [Roseivirga pacifica]|uniref:SusC/RagA family TonB-linked outer membrane protein n=1 Tax=Roseivirga pacifica TaxID=1267423 RepID=UPI002094CD75|nr:SusC/RagA family TonB-linked outer membrane protein [Roseivirga pacifica]MCO6358520.1 SusC/RagA family TonB-linked outer membrane protein [Roseivirga pacifica]MCO6369075.1 SusC/RagA family TonB-linked outer membrane protein [Roseivirga pacifica]MCO6372221.1 SusC/RagA family TonB-linked outer membrane protein [Roseivirga pacifica]MCO6374251.1 SusC/RagA family TonB-linked outer membrane protein [Roseivirga pacifica]MCO6380952.1 SusC/RagA family TonB-linked outer membrane protein [Roseivirga p